MRQRSFGFMLGAVLGTLLLGWAAWAGDKPANRCVLPGDGAGNGAPLAYEQCADGLTVADLNTGLLWEKKVAAGSGSTTCLGALHGVSSTCTWPRGTRDWIAAVNAEGGTGFAGFSDWRVPSVKELQSIVHYSALAPSIDPAFGPTESSFYWSATSSAGYPGSAWLVNFVSGETAPGTGKSTGVYGRAVRTGSCP